MKYFRKASLIFVLILMAICGNVFAQEQAPKKTRYLHISTNPSSVDLFTNAGIVDFANRPNYTSPAFIPIPEGSEDITVSFFHPDYADTTINIKLSQNDTSYIIIALRQTYDEDILVSHQETLKHRNRRNLGRTLQWFSIAPFAIGSVSTIVTLYNISKANDHKKAMENTRFKNENYDVHMRDFEDYRNSARTGKTVSKFFFGTGLLLLSAGFILSF